MGNTPAPRGRDGSGRGARDVMVTGMGFCLPGLGAPVYTAADLWEIAANGKSCLVTDCGVPFAPVRLPEGEVEKHIPEIPGAFARHFTDTHRFGLLSLDAACTDAALNFRAGDLTAAAILAGRANVDANMTVYSEMLAADFATITPAAGIELFVRGMLGSTPSDVTLVQAGLTQATGPCFTVSCGCCSSAVQLANAAMMISSGTVDLAVVSGVDTLNAGVVNKGQQVLQLLARASEVDPAIGVLRLPPSVASPMRPYDRKAQCSNFGEGGATLILESREHADRRGARCHGEILSAAVTRDGLPNPLTSDETGRGLAAAVRRCLGDRWSVDQVPYVHGASDGDLQTTAIECEAIADLYGPDADGLLMSSQEACFGHNGGPAGCVGVGLITLMMARGEVCPTANCDEPADGLPFDPVPGTKTRPLDFDYALNFSYQLGGMKTVILVGSPDAA